MIQLPRDCKITKYNIYIYSIYLVYTIRHLAEYVYLINNIMSLREDVQYYI